MGTPSPQAWEGGRQQRPRNGPKGGEYRKTTSWRQGRAVALLAQLAVALTVTRAAAGEATDVADAAGHAMAGLKATEAATPHPPPESRDALLTPTDRKSVV